jgi:hypothetical protein
MPGLAEREDQALSLEDDPAHVATYAVRLRPLGEELRHGRTYARRPDQHPRADQRSVLLALLVETQDQKGSVLPGTLRLKRVLRPVETQPAGQGVRKIDRRAVDPPHEIRQAPRQFGPLAGADLGIQASGMGLDLPGREGLQTKHLFLQAVVVLSRDGENVAHLRVCQAPQMLQLFQERCELVAPQACSDDRSHCIRVPSHAPARTNARHREEPCGFPHAGQAIAQVGAARSMDTVKKDMSVSSLGPEDRAR